MLFERIWQEPNVNLNKSFMVWAGKEEKNKLTWPQVVSWRDNQS